MKFFIDLDEQEFQFFLSVLNERERKEFEIECSGVGYDHFHLFRKPEMLQKMIDSLLDQRSTYLANDFFEHCKKLEKKRWKINFTMLHYQI